MQIDKEKCTGCGACVPYCPVAAIARRKKDKEAGTGPYSEIIIDECVECAVCLRSGACPEEAIFQDELVWPRTLRKAFSDPIYVHPGTDVPGRGTEEMKTNDVTGRFRNGFIGVGLEFGRPGTGTRLTEPQKAIKKLLALGVELEPLNPLTQLIENPETGDLKADVLNEKVLSAIVECIIPIDRAGEVLAAVEAIAAEIETVFSLDLICKVADDKSLPILDKLKEAGLTPSLNGKVNVGLGRPLYQAREVAS